MILPLLEGTIKLSKKRKREDTQKTQVQSSQINCDSTSSDKKAKKIKSAEERLINGEKKGKIKVENKEKKIKKKKAKYQEENKSQDEIVTKAEDSIDRVKQNEKNQTKAGNGVEKEKNEIEDIAMSNKAKKVIFWGNKLFFFVMMITFVNRTPPPF